MQKEQKPPSSRQQLIEFTKNREHHGLNKLNILYRFQEYISMCIDPENIYRYMEQKAICTFLPQFWIHKAEYLALIGDYRGCFECIQEAHSRNGICEDQKEQVDNNYERVLDISKIELNLLNQMINQMKAHPSKSKRTIDQFNLLGSPTKIMAKDSSQRYIKLLSIYQQRYGGLKKQKQTKYQLKRQKNSKSWLASIYEKQQVEQKKIECKIHENSLKLSKDIKYHSMHTPLKHRDPQRLTKTMDSVQILKRKKSTNQKSRKSKTILNYDSQQEIQSDKTSGKIFASVPVGKSLSKLKRRVTFQMIREIKYPSNQISPNTSLAQQSQINNKQQRQRQISVFSNEKQIENISYLNKKDDNL